jgi:DNA-binding phage protein
MQREDLIETIRRKYQRVAAVLDERARRVWAAAEAEAIGYGGQSIVAKATGLSRVTLHRAMLEQTAGVPQAPTRIRSAGGGRPKRIRQEVDLLAALEALVEPSTRGDPENALRWTCQSTRQLARALVAQGYPISHQTVASLLDELGYSLQGNQKIKEGGHHPDRDAQFQYIHERVGEFQHRGQPVVSVDTKKKELVGDFKNAGRTWRPKGTPEAVRVYDFVDKVLGKVNPYGVYDPTANVGWVSVGIDHDTAEFAVETLRRWWEHMGHARYPSAQELLVTADGGGSNGARVRLWKVALQRLANDIGLRISVCQFPPGTSKWNKIEHRMFSYISMNWRGKPLVSHEVIVKLIAGTSTQAGLTIEAELDTNSYPKGIKISDEELERVRIQRADFHGEWNYTILPNA